MKLKTCCICRNPIEVNQLTGWAGGHNAAPVMDGRCCAECNDIVVLPTRIRRMKINLNNTPKKD